MALEQQSLQITIATVSQPGLGTNLGTNFSQVWVSLVLDQLYNYFLLKLTKF